LGFRTTKRVKRLCLLGDQKYLYLSPNAQPSLNISNLTLSTKHSYNARTVTIREINEYDRRACIGKGTPCA